MKYVDNHPKKNPAILDNFMLVPDVLTNKQKQALKRIQQLHRRKFTEVS